MRILIGYIGLYLIITFGSMFFASIFKKKIEKTIAISLSIDVLILFVFAAFDILKIGVICISIINIILGIIALIREKKNVFNIINTPGFFFFSIVYFVFAITTYKKELVEWDHFSYRSVNTKMMYNADSMFEYAKFYPPASTLLQYFFMKVIGIYKQGIEAFAMQMFGFSLLIPMFDSVKNNKFAKFTTAVIILCIPAVFRLLIFYESAYPDATLGLLLGYILYVYFSKDNIKYKIIAIGTTIAILVLTKPLGIVLALITICVLFIYEILKKRFIEKINVKSLIKSREFKLIIVISIVMLAVYGSWEILQKCTDPIDSPATIAGNNNRVKGNPIEYVFDSVITTVFGKAQENYDGALSNRNLITTFNNTLGLTTPIKLTLSTTSILFFIGFIIYYYQTKDKKIKYQTLALGIGIILYIIAIQISYLTKFSNEEMLKHSGIDRYFPPYLIAMLYYICAIYMDNLNKKEYKAKSYLIILIIIFMITPIQSICDATITSGIYNINSIQYLNNAENIAEKIDREIEDDSKVVTISQNEETKLFNIMLRYYLYPNHDTKVFQNLTVDNKRSFEKILNDYQYIYVFSTDEELLEMLNLIFDNINDIKDKTLYKIEYENNDNQVRNIKLVEYAYLDAIF